MNRFRPGALLLVGVFLASALASPASALAAPHHAAVTLKLLSSSGPHAVSLKQPVITIRLKITGITLHKASSKNVPGQGHVQIYMGNVPADAYTKGDLKGIVSIYYNNPESIEFDKPWIRKFKGKRTLLITLSRNNGVLYRTTVPKFSLTVS